MDVLKIRKPDYKRFIHLKQAGFSVDRYTTRDLEGFPSYLNWFEIKGELKKLEPHYFSPTLQELTKAIEVLKEVEPKTALYMLSVKWARTDDIICWPDANWFYAPNIEPRIQRGRHPVLIQKADEEKRGDEFIIKGGERIEIPDFPRKPGKIMFEIKELGANKGTYIFTNPHKYREEENYGLRSLYFSSYARSLKRKCINTTFPPWHKNENIEFHIFSKRTEEPSLEDYILKDPTRHCLSRWVKNNPLTR